MNLRIKIFILSITICLLNCSLIFGQGLNSNWLLCYEHSPFDKARIYISDTSISVLTDQRKMAIDGSTQGNISDKNGNLLMSSNGVWIANANGDTMKNGAGLNPNAFTSNWPQGLPISNANVFLPVPEDSNKYILFHQTGADSPSPEPSTELYYSIIDITGDSGLGEVLVKNSIFANGLFGWGIGVCKHANGRDWWIIALSDSGNVAYSFLLSPSGVNSHGSQNLSVPGFEFAGQPTFSPDGTRFAFNSGFGISANNWIHNLNLFDFDRCTGLFSNTRVISLDYDTYAGFGVAFSPNSNVLYACSWYSIYQFNLDSSNIAASEQIVAVFDTFPSPFPPFYTDFWLMYHAADGKVYLTSGSSVGHLHYINYPDSIGFASDPHLHDIPIPCLHIQGIPFHPNYYLGPEIGSVCDSLSIGIEEISHEFNFKVYPNPNHGMFNISYLLPQNKRGEFIVLDIAGRLVYRKVLPEWSTLQNLDLSDLESGVYFSLVRSDNLQVTKKVVITN